MPYDNRRPAVAGQGLWGFVRMMRMVGLLVSLSLVSACASAPVYESAARAPSVDAFFETEIREHRLQGAVVVVVRDDGIAYARAFGHRDRAARDRMRTDDLFRLFSMTKPITTAAVLILAEEGAISLDDPIGRHLPEFARPRVYAPAAAQQDARPILAATRNPTILDLLRHTSGLTYGQGGRENLHDYSEAGLLPEVWFETNPMRGRTNADVSEILGALPLAFEPGSQWAYGRSTDVLGRLVEVVSGLTLDEFLRRKLFEPLGMRDTGFNVRAAGLARVVEPSLRAAQGEPRTYMTDLSVRQTFLSGGGGLVGSGHDYARFLRMLLNGGELDGARVLSSRSIDLMMSDQIAALANHPGFNLGKGYTFGLGGFVRDFETSGGLRREFGWWGAGGTAFWCDRAERLCGILLIQQSDEARRLSNGFHDLARREFGA